MAEQADSARPVTTSTRRWAIRRPASVWASSILLLTPLLVVVLLVRRWLSLPIGLEAVAVGVAVAAAAAIALLAAVRLYSCLTLHYIIAEHTLTIVWGTARWVVPLRAVLSRPEPTPEGAAPAVGDQAVLVDSVFAPGFRIGRGYVKDKGRALFFTTLPPAESVVVRTAQCRYLLSPHDPLGFLAELEQRRATAGPAVGAEPPPGVVALVRRPAVAAPALLAALAFLLNVALYAYIAWWYPALPAQMPVHFAATGAADGWAAPATLFRLPLIGTLIIGADVILSLLPALRSQPVLTCTLTGAALVAQLLLWTAFLLLLP